MYWSRKTGYGSQESEDKTTCRITFIFGPARQNENLNSNSMLWFSRSGGLRSSDFRLPTDL
jgi:hypothetical protein